MSHLTNLKKAHPLAEIMEAPNMDNLFLVRYPDLVLAFSIKYILAFYAEGNWHISIGQQSSNTIKRHKEMLVKTFKFSKFYESRADMLDELLRISLTSTISDNG